MFPTQLIEDCPSWRRTWKCKECCETGTGSCAGRGSWKQSMLFYFKRLSSSDIYFWHLFLPSVPITHCPNRGTHVDDWSTPCRRLAKSKCTLSLAKSLRSKKVPIVIETFSGSWVSQLANRGWNVPCIQPQIQNMFTLESYLCMTLMSYWRTCGRQRGSKFR